MPKTHYLFIDESGDPSLKSVNPDFPVFVLLGILIEKGTYQQLCADFNTVKNKYFGSIGVILHSTDIRKCNGPFAALFDLKIKRAFYEDLNRILATTDYKIVSSVINKTSHIKKYGKLADDPYEIGLTFLLERTLFELDKGNFEADVHIESRGKREDAILASRYNQLISRGSQISPDRFVTKYGTEVTFKKKWENDCGLQLADLCAYPVARRVLFPKEPYPTFQVIESKFRRGPRGVLGYGIKVFP